MQYKELKAIELELNEENNKIYSVSKDINGQYKLFHIFLGEMDIKKRV
jgi:hypothetical protein